MIFYLWTSAFIFLFVWKSTPYFSSKNLSRRVRKNGSSKKGISIIEQRSANDELYISPMYFQRGRKEISVERICDKNRVTEGDVYRTGGKGKTLTVI